jgi:hypothetical protein
VSGRAVAQPGVLLQGQEGTLLLRHHDLKVHHGKGCCLHSCRPQSTWGHVGIPPSAGGLCCMMWRGVLGQRSGPLLALCRGAWAWLLLACLLRHLADAVGIGAAGQ